MLEWGIRKKIEQAFYDYEQNRKTGAEYIDNLAYEGMVVNLNRVGGSGGKVGNPTEAKGIKAVQGNKDYLWCSVVENTLKYFESDKTKQDLISMKYKQHFKVRTLCTELYVEEATVFRWLDEILTYATMLAIQFRLIKII